MFRRLLLAVPAVVGATVLIFLAMRVIPGNPLRTIGGEGQIMVLTDEQVSFVRRSLGLDRPLGAQYLDWMGDVLKGNFGYSFWRDRDPIRDILLRRGPITAQIA